MGRANRACALIGTSSSASTSGQTTGPPAENAYAVEPVGVANTTPSHPHRDSGRPSTSITMSSIRSRAAFSTLASFSAQVVAVTSPFARTVTSIVIRCSIRYFPSTTRSTASDRSSGSASARKPTWPRLTPSSGTPAGPGQLGRAQQGAVAADHQHHLRAARRPGTRPARPRLAAGPRSAASGSRTRTVTPAAVSRSTTRRATRTPAGRPVCATTSMVRFDFTVVLP